MAKMMNMGVLVMALSFTATLLHGVAGDDLVVGDTVGWTIPPNPGFYSSWASNHTFKVGDTLVFNFPTGSHDVIEVSSQAFDACNTAGSANQITNGPARVTLNAAGNHFYVCGVPGHCPAGQKLSVRVVADDDNDNNNDDDSAPAPSGTTDNNNNNSPPVAALPPSSTAATASGRVGLVSVFVFVAVAAAGLF